MADKVSERARQRAPGPDGRAASELILAAAADGVLVADELGEIRYRNRAAEYLLGEAAGALAGGLIGRELVPREAGELELSLPGGAERVLDVRVSTVVVHGEVLRIACLRDITERKQAERSLEAELGRHGAALAVAGHELRGPLAAIGVLAHVLADDQAALDPAERRDVAARVAAHAGRLQLIVTRLLTSARLDAGAARPASDAVDVAAVIGGLLAAADRSGGRDVTVSCQDRLTVLADREDVTMMVGNYLDNALTYASPPVAIWAGTKAAMAQIEVSDGGPGVPDSFVPRLFDRFARAPGAGMRGDGLGLGLWIVRTLARANAGDAWYEPNAGGGSRFCLRLPLAGQPPAGPATGGAR